MSKIKPKKHPKAGIPISECARCGTCCIKGGPSFHHEDKELIDKGIILSKFLYTIREGELSYDNVKECLLPAASDIIKIKGQKDSWTCAFFNENECTIYDNRPLECRLLTCWDTREIEKVYSKNRLTRKDLLSAVEGLWDLIEEHQINEVIISPQLSWQDQLIANISRSVTSTARVSVVPSLYEMMISKLHHLLDP